MFENITQFFKRFKKSEKEESKSTAKERLHLVLAQDRANISADFLEMMKQEIIEVIKKYIDIDEKAIDVRLTNKECEDGSMGAPALYANIPILTIKNEARKLEGTLKKGINSNNENVDNKNTNINENELEHNGNKAYEIKEINKDYINQNKLKTDENGNKDLKTDNAKQEELKQNDLEAEQYDTKGSNVENLDVQEDEKNKSVDNRSSDDAINADADEDIGEINQNLDKNKSENVVNNKPNKGKNNLKNKKTLQKKEKSKKNTY